jgi:hypothetical protein
MLLTLVAAINQLICIGSAHADEFVIVVLQVVIPIAGTPPSRKK